MNSRECVIIKPEDWQTLAPAQCSTAGDNDGAEKQPSKKWCAWCGVWGNHTSGACADLHEVMLRRRAENEKP